MEGSLFNRPFQSRTLVQYITPVNPCCCFLSDRLTKCYGSQCRAQSQVPSRRTAVTSLLCCVAVAIIQVTWGANTQRRICLPYQPLLTDSAYEEILLRFSRCPSSSLIIRPQSIRLLHRHRLLFFSFALLGIHHRLHEPVVFQPVLRQNFFPTIVSNPPVIVAT